MAEINNIFDNSAVVTPSIAGQIDTEPAADAMIDTNQTATPVEGQVATEGQTDVVPETPPTGWQAEYSSPEEMYDNLQKVKKSYDNIRPQYTKVTQELSTIKKQSTAPAATQQQVVQPQQQANPIQLIIDKVQDIVRPVQEQNEELMMHNAVSRMIQTHPDFTEVAPDVSSILETNPALWQTENPIELAYKIAKANKIANVVETTKQAAYADKDLKVLNSGTKTPINNQTAPKSAEAMIRESILSASSRGGSIF